MGKTTFINTLFSTTIKNYADHKRRHQKQIDRTVEIEITKAELEEKFFKGSKPTYSPDCSEESCCLLWMLMALHLSSSPDRH